MHVFKERRSTLIGGFFLHNIRKAEGYFKETRSQRWTSRNRSNKINSNAPILSEQKSP